MIIEVLEKDEKKWKALVVKLYDQFEDKFFIPHNHCLKKPRRILLSNYSQHYFWQSDTQKADIAVIPDYKVIDEYIDKFTIDHKAEGKTVISFGVVSYYM